VVIGAVGRFRRKMAHVQEESDVYKKYAGKWWVRALVFLFVGGGLKQRRYAELATKKVGNPIRVFGVVLVVLAGALVWVALRFMGGPIATMATQSALERANGATVDVGSVELDAPRGKAVLSGLAMADAGDLSKDILRAARVEADVSTRDLLRKRITMDRVVLVDATSGEARRVPGRLIGKRPPPKPKAEGEKTIEDYIEQARTWKERLTQAKKWLDEVSKRVPKKEAPPGAPPEERETLKERLEREVREKGYARVAASHLVEGSPTVLVKELLAQEMKVAALPDEAVDMQGRDLSTQPWLVADAPEIAVKSSGGTIDATVVLGSVTATAAAPSTARVACRGLATDSLGIAAAGVRPVQGGTTDVDLDVALGAEISGTLAATVRDATVAVAGASRRVERLTVPIGLAGPLDDPRIRIDQDALAKALIDAGAAELASKVKGEAAKEVEKAKEKLGEKLGEEAGKAIGDFLGGGKDKKNGG